MPPKSSDDEKSLFFAYARRSDHDTFSRYMLTFADRDTAEEWWKLVSAEYPDTVRSNPQLFSFTGDGKPSQIWSNKKFEQLKTRWLYTQFGDAKDTHGGAQSTIPVQSNGYNGGGSAGSGSGGSIDISPLTAAIEKGNKENASQMQAMMKELANAQKGSSGSDGSLDIDKLAALIEKGNKQNFDQLQGAIKPIPEQIQQLAAAQKTTSNNLNQLQKIVEQQGSQSSTPSRPSSGGKGASVDVDRLQKIIEDQNKQMEAARQSSSAETTRLQKMIDQQSKQNDALTSKLSDLADLLGKNNQAKPAAQSSPSTSDSDLQKVVQQQSKQIELLTWKLGEVVKTFENSSHACQCGQSTAETNEHDCNVKPPPRKLNRQVTGYRYR